MSRDLVLSGATRVLVIVGDPIAQVKSPAGVTAGLLARGRDAVVVPAHVAPAELDAYVEGTRLARNLDGIIVTVPHKFAACAHCATVTPRARLLSAVNVMRRNDDGTWHGDMVDGLAFVSAMRLGGCEPRGKRALLAGAGGAGSAIALALLDEGVAELSIHDADAARREALIARLSTVHTGRVRAGGADPAGFDIVANATPMGMREGDPYPVDVARLSASTFVGDVVTQPAVPPLIAAARAAGCRTHTGIDMFNAVSELIVDFYCAAGPLARPVA